MSESGCNDTQNKCNDLSERSTSSDDSDSDNEFQDANVNDDHSNQSSCNEDENTLDINVSLSDCNLSDTNPPCNNTSGLELRTDGSSFLQRISPAVSAAHSRQGSVDSLQLLHMISEGEVPSEGDFDENPDDVRLVDSPRYIQVAYIVQQISV